ncbi:hypothetical protein ORV05_34420 [Amycolatopsis cynarae]|uniref:DUF2867 domain-containing protein n=1 Tax=Amycolatopsis cynarae TaxID=2995223 RepID=A0ABY7B4S0_9PSEU|nr:hypothetical protein [Amycolatopsis sp. HUAS 11-8]WAL65896.1 hypothetical protein ORV05_34420 [Amycolatopsis sp. HUAS 11-8]
MAATLVEGLPGVAGGGRFQGRRIVDGQLAPAPIGGEPMRLTTPDGDRVTSALMPLGELLAAERASQARFVGAASNEAPSGGLLRLIVPAGLMLLHIGPLRRFLTRRLAAVKVSDSQPGREPGRRPPRHSRRPVDGLTARTRQMAPLSMSPLPYWSYFETRAS